MQNSVLTSNLSDVNFFDINSGAKISLGTIQFRSIYDIAVNPITHETYGLSGSDVYHLNFSANKNITVDFVGSAHITGIGGMEFGADGKLYLSGGNIYTMNLTDGSTTKITDLGGQIANGDLSVVGNTLYTIDPYNAKMYSVNLNTLQKTTVASGLPENSDGMVMRDGQTYLFHDHTITKYNLDNSSSQDVLTTTSDTSVFTGATALSDSIIKIDGQLVALGTDSNAAQVYRLYQAAFGRAPDVGGLSAHTNAVNHGLSLHDDAASFAGSPEFAMKYGTNVSDQLFVNALYKNVLDRAPDAAGNANWLNALSSHTIDRATALIGFSESLENHNKVDPTIQSGIHLDYGYIS